MEKANPLIETEDDNAEQLTGGGALSGTVPSQEHEFSRSAERGSAPFSRSTTQLSAGVSAGASAGPAGSSSYAPRTALSGMQPRAVKPAESGVFSGLTGQVTGEQLVDSLQSALSAASRGEAGLGSLHRSVRDASRALTSLRHAHESLGEELRVMYRGLNEVMSEKAAVERYAALLTQERDAALDAAEEARREAKREREFLLREQDRFIQLLLEEHEAELQQLRRALSGRSSAPPPVVIAPPVVAPALTPAAPAVIVHTEPTTGFRIGVEVKPGDRELEAEEGASTNDIEATLRAVEVRAVEVRAVEERRAVVPMPRPDLDETPLGAVLSSTMSSAVSSPVSSARADSAVRSGPPPLPRLQLAPSQPPAADTDEFEPGTERGIGERNTALDRSLTERHLLDTLRSEVPADEADGRSRTYPPPPALLDLDSLAAEVEGNSERPPPIRRISAVEPKLHLKPAKVPTQLLDTLISRTDGDEPEEKLEDKLQDKG